MACRIHSLFELADDYLARADWRDIALLKFCLAALGVLIGISLPKEKHKGAALCAGAVFIATYIPLMKKVVGIIGERRAEAQLLEREMTE